MPHMTTLGETNPNNLPITPSAPIPQVRCFTLGPYQTNCYVIWVPGDPACWIIDASFGPAPIIRFVRESGLVPAALILTHAHVDHIAGVREVVSAFPPAPGLPVWIHEAEGAWLNDPMLNLSAIGGVPTTAPGPDRLLRQSETLALAGSTWRVLHTPGHSPGGICLVHDESKTAIVGDALFAGSIGRTDFPGGSHDVLIASIRASLYTLPGDTKVYPGHGPATTIEREKRSNPYTKG